VKPELEVGSSSRFVPVGLPGGASLPFQFVVSDLAEVMEPEIPLMRGVQQAAACGGCPAEKAPSSLKRDIPRRLTPASPFHKGE